MYEVAKFVTSKVNYKKTKIMGADISYNGTGLVALQLYGTVFSHDLLNSRTIENKKGETELQKCSNIHYETSGCIDKYLENHLDMLVFEDVTVSKHFQGMIGVATAKGALLTSVADTTKEEPFLVPVINTQIKKMLTGSGKSNKEEIAQELEVANFSFYDDNQADAYGAAMIGIALMWLSQYIVKNVRDTSDLGVLSKEMLIAIKEAEKHWPKALEMGITDKQFQVIRSLMEGPKLIKANDQKHYEKTRKKLKKLEGTEG